MIDTRELRIGNLVMINNKVITMDARIFHAVIHGFEGYEPEPIPLTEEWLIKFGFTHHESIGVWKLNFNISTQAGDYEFAGVPNSISFVSNGMFGSGSMRFVHQLQNLYFALTGEELTIKETV